MGDIHRGEVWLVDPKKRPALVVSADEFNNCPAELVMVLPITSTDTGIPSHIRVDAPEGGVKKKSFIKCDQIRTISKKRLIKRWGRVSDDAMQKVGRALRYLLCL